MPSFFCQVERRFHIRELNRQPLPRDLGISPPSSSSLGLSHTTLYLAFEPTIMSMVFAQCPIP